MKQNQVHVLSAPAPLVPPSREVDTTVGCGNTQLAGVRHFHEDTFHYKVRLSRWNHYISTATHVVLYNSLNPRSRGGHSPFIPSSSFSLGIHCTHLLSIFCPGINLMETVIFPTMTLKHPESALRFILLHNCLLIPPYLKFSRVREPIDWLYIIKMDLWLYAWWRGSGAAVYSGLESESLTGIVESGWCQIPTGELGSSVAEGQQQ